MHHALIDDGRGYWGNLAYVIRDFYAHLWDDITGLLPPNTDRSMPFYVAWSMGIAFACLLPFIWILPVGLVHLEYVELWSARLYMAVASGRKRIVKWGQKILLQWYLTRYLEAGHFEGKITTEPVELSVGGRIIVPHRPPAEEFWNAQDLPMDIRILISDAL